LNLARKKISLFFLILFYSVKFFAQVPVNGFCQEKELRIPPGFTKFNYFNINEDSLKDIFLYGNDQKEFAVLYGNSDSTFAAPVKKFFFYPVTDFHFFNSIPKLGKYYIFISNGKRVAGLSSFSKDGTMLLINQITFDSYPGKLIIADFDKDGKNDALVLGSNFNGLSLLIQNKFKLNKIELLKNRIFSDAVIYDVDFDDYQDLLAIDLVSNSIVVLINNEMGGFKQAREIYFEENIKKLKTINFNNDIFDDVAFVNDNNLEVMFGDSVSSFQNKKVYELNNNLNDFALYDFNGDNKIDIAYTNQKKNQLFIDFPTPANRESKYLLKRGGIYSGIKANAAGKNKLSVISSKGSLFFFEKILPADSVKLSFGDSVSALLVKDFNNDNNLDFCYVDTFDNSMNLMISNKNGICQNYYNIPLLGNVKNIKPFIIDKNITGFYFFNKNKRLVEFIELNFSNGLVSKRIMYGSSPVENVITLNKNILLLENNNGELELEKFSESDKNFIRKDSLKISGNYLKPFFITRQRNSHLYYFTLSSDSLLLKEYDPLKHKLINSNFIAVNDTASKVQIKTSPQFKLKNKDYVLVLVRRNYVVNYYLFNGKKLTLLSPKGEIINSINPDRIEINIYADKAVKNDELYITDYEINTIFKAAINYKNPEVELIPLYKSVGINKSAVGLFNQKKYLVVSDSSNIKLILLKKND